MKNQIIKVAQDLEQGTISDNEAINILKGLFISHSQNSNEKLFNLVVKFPAEKLEIKEICGNSETVKTIDINW